MLRFLRIRNFAIIDTLEIDFTNGLCVVTGETGAGKSILLDAISLILGSRAHADVIRTGAEEATVEAVFDIKKDAKIQKRLKQFEIEDTEELLIKRVVQKSGKGKILINGELVTLAQLSNICESLVELCSQHEHQSLVKSSYQLDLIDRYGDLFKNRDDLSKMYTQWMSFETERKKLLGIEEGSTTARTEDFLKFQLEEIRSFDPQEGEEEELNLERKRLMNTTQLLDATAVAAACLDSEEGLGAQGLLIKAIQRLQKASEHDPELSPLIESLERSRIEVDEASQELSRYASKLEVDPHRQDEVESRLNTWTSLKKKYGADAKSIIQYADEIEKELRLFETKNERIAELDDLIEKSQKDYLKKAQELSKKRKALSKTLSSAIESELKELSMPHTKFTVEFSQTEAQENGIDHVQFLFSANAGEEPKSISKVASGGELSRLMLALRTTIADRGTIGVYLFDEIDAGIGGQTASIVGRKLNAIAAYNQVICITHLPQVAAFANAHLHVTKKVQKGRTTSEVTELKDQIRIEELARMLGGLQVTEKSRAHARDLLKDARA